MHEHNHARAHISSKIIQLFASRLVGASPASTIPATEAELAAARCQPRAPAPAPPGDIHLRTPEDKIRRTSSAPVLKGPIGDMLILAQNDAQQLPSKSKSKSTKGKKNKGKAGGKTKKKHLKKTKKPKVNVGTVPSKPMGSTGQQDVKQTQNIDAIAEHPPAPAPSKPAACKKSAAKKPRTSEAPASLAEPATTTLAVTNAPTPEAASLVKIEPKSERMRRRLEVATPQTEKNKRVLQRAEAANMARATTQDQFTSPQASTAAPPVTCSNSQSDQTEYYAPESQYEPSEVGSCTPSELARLDDKDDDDDNEQDKASQPAVPAANGKRKKQKTREQKATHARYMRFSRSLTSILI